MAERLHAQRALDPRTVPGLSTRWTTQTRHVPTGSRPGDVTDAKVSKVSRLGQQQRKQLTCFQNGKARAWLAYKQRGGIYMNLPGKWGDDSPRNIPSLPALLLKIQTHDHITTHAVSRKTGTPISLFEEKYRHGQKQVYSCGYAKQYMLILPFINYCLLCCREPT